MEHLNPVDQARQLAAEVVKRLGQLNLHRRELYGAQNETYIEGWEKKTSNLLIYKRLCKI